MTPRRLESKTSSKINRSKSNESNKSIGSAKLKSKYPVKTNTNSKINLRVTNLEEMIKEMYQVFKKTDESRQISQRSEKPSINFDDLQDPRPKSVVKERNTSIDHNDNDTSVKLKSKFNNGKDGDRYRMNNKIDVENNDKYDFNRLRERESESEDADEKRITEIINKSMKSKSNKNFKLTKKKSNECNISNISNLSEKDKRYSKMKIEYDN